MPIINQTNQLLYMTHAINELWTIFYLYEEYYPRYNQVANLQANLILQELMTIFVLQLFNLSILIYIIIRGKTLLLPSTTEVVGIWSMVGGSPSRAQIYARSLLRHTARHSVHVVFFTHQTFIERCARLMILDTMLCKKAMLWTLKITLYLFRYKLMWFQQLLFGLVLQLLLTT